MNASSKFRSLVEYAKGHEKDIQKIIMQPDENLQKINEVKVSMLKQSMVKAEREKWPEIREKIEVSLPETLNIVHCEGYHENLKDALARNVGKVSDLSECTGLFM
jgi:hypothetical protein